MTNGGNDNCEDVSLPLWPPRTPGPSCATTAAAARGLSTPPEAANSREKTRLELSLCWCSSSVLLAWVLLLLLRFP
eukprot:9476960-Pyramimonas_sp.AAC.1